MFGTVETHVLKEVCKTALVLLFLNGAHLLCNVEVYKVLRIVVVTDIICQSVLEFADSYRWVDRKLLTLLLRHGWQCQHDKQQRHQSKSNKSHVVNYLNVLLYHFNNILQS